MRRRHLIACWLACLCLGRGAAAAGTPGEFRVLTYNIWNGADAGKAGRLVEWVKARDPDLIALQELVGFDADRLAQTSATWGHPHSVILKEDGYPVGVTSRHPIEVVERIRDGLSHGALHVRVAGLECFIVHLHPGDVDVRMREARELMKRVGPLLDTGGRVLVLGDFNAHSADDRGWLDHQRVLLNRRRGTPNLRDGKWDHAVMGLFLEGGLKDLHMQTGRASDRRKGSFPTRVFDDSREEAARMARCERIDFILASTPVATSCIRVEILRGGPLDRRISDHYPVEADFRGWPVP